MKILLRNVRLVQDGHPLDGQLIEVGISNGKIASLDGAEPANPETVVDVQGLCLSAGWVDLRASIGEPGHENREQLTTGTRAAARGGFTELALLPSAQAVPQTRAAIEYIKARTATLPARIRPMAALTVDMAGNDLTEITDLHFAGAAAFSDGNSTINRADVLARALEYMQPTEGLVMQRPLQKDFAAGVMHEGVASTRLGLKGIPGMAEELVVQRDLQLLAYTGGKLHFSLISTRGSVERIKQAKRDGLCVTCDVAAHQIAFTDETLQPFDSNYKVNPPFRSQRDLKALKKGLEEGTIDAIVSDHQPYDPESKDLEFDLAEFGITGLETAFAVANTSLAGKVPLNSLIRKFTDNPRKILGLEKPLLEIGAEANFTLFDPEKEWVFREEETESMSRNSPFYGKPLRGKVYATVLGRMFTPNRFW